MGAAIVRKAVEQPARSIAENAGIDGAVVVAKIQKSTDPHFGYNAEAGTWGDMFTFGIVDPTKVTRSALQNAASVAGLLLTTEAIIVEKKSKKGGPRRPSRRSRRREWVAWEEWVAWAEWG